MPHPSKVFAGVEVIPLCDAVGPMGPSLRKPLDQTFPGASPEDWAGLDTAEWVLHFHSYLFRDPAAGTVLVDTGIGGHGSPAAGWAPVPGGLIGELAAAGVEPADVDVVVLTHLHSDHASGAVADGVPVFPGARHLIQRDELEWVRGAVRDQVVVPLGDLVQAIEGPMRLAPEIAVVPTPGHTPGHQSVEIGSLTLTGDVVLHPVQLANPSIHYLHDEDPERAAATRTALVERARSRAGTLGTAHFAEPFVAPSPRG